MPRWIALALMTAAAWLVIAVVGGLLLGRVLGLLDRGPGEAGEAAGGRRPRGR
jgi:hypothetical protein